MPCTAWEFRRTGAKVASMRSSSSTVDVSRWLIIAVAATASLTAVTLYILGALAPFQNAAIDDAFALRGARPPPTDIVIVAVDDKTLEGIGTQLPIPRTYYANVLDVLHRAGARLIGLDLQFLGSCASRPDDRALLKALDRDGPVLVSVSDSGAGVPTIVGVRAPPGVLPASGAVDTDGDGVLRRLLFIQVSLPTFPIRAAEALGERSVAAA